MMLTSSGSGPISSVTRPKTYYTSQRRGAAAQPQAEAVSSGEYVPDPMAIAGRILFMAEE